MQAKPPQEFNLTSNFSIDLGNQENKVSGRKAFPEASVSGIDPCLFPPCYLLLDDLLTYYLSFRSLRLTNRGSFYFRKDLITDLMTRELNCLVLN